MAETISKGARASLYARVVAELDQARLPWVQPWDSARCACAMLHNAATERAYSGVNILILWRAVLTRLWHAALADLAQAGGERGTTICYAGRFTPKHDRHCADELDRAAREARQIAFLKRFIVFNIEQCEGLPYAFTNSPARAAATSLPPKWAMWIGCWLVGSRAKPRPEIPAGLSRRLCGGGCCQLTVALSLRGVKRLVRLAQQRLELASSVGSDRGSD